MADLKTYNFKSIMTCAMEAERTLPGYTPDETGIERRAILNKEKSMDNITLICHECIKIKPGSKNQTEALKKVYREKFGKNPRKNTVAGALFLGLPKTFLPADYNLPPSEYAALTMELMNQPGIDKKVLESAHKKLLSRDFSDAEKDAIKDFFEKSIPVLCKILGIKKDDILYAIVHMDESFPHLHFAFLPAKYVADKEAWDEYQSRDTKGKCPKTLLGDTNRIIEAAEEPIGCGVERFDRKFLFCLNKNLEAGFREHGIDVKIANGKGQINDVQKASKKQREAATIARAVEEESKRRNKDMQKEFDTKHEEYSLIINEQVKKIKDNKKTITEQMATIKTNAETIKKQNEDIKYLDGKIKDRKALLKRLRKSIEKAENQLEEIKERIIGWVDDGLIKIRKALSRKDKEKEAEKASDELLNYASEIMTVLPEPDDYDMEEEKEYYSEENSDLDI